MKTMNKTVRILSVLAILLCLTIALGITAFAAENDVTASGTWGGIDWTLTADGTLTIAPTKGEPTTDNSGKWTYTVGQWPEAVVYNGKGVAQVEGGEPYAKYKNQITNLVIEEGVTSIGSFTGWFPNLTGEVVIPSTVTYIGQDCFNSTPITKLTFAKVPEGQTGNEICIAHGAFKGLNIEEAALPDDRPVHLHCWTFLNCKQLKHLTLPATVYAMVGSNHIDYLHNPNAQANNGWKGYSQIVGGLNSKDKSVCNPDLETITFGSEEVKELFFSYGDNKVGTVKYGVAFVVSGANTIDADNEENIVYCTSLKAAANIAKPGDIITLTANTDEVVEIPAGVTLDMGEFTAPGVTVAKPFVAQIGEQGYATLADALAAANAGDTITFLADITEDVTINKAITIDGAGKTYTGTITLSKTYATINFNNINFIEGYVASAKGAIKGSYINVTNCDFDGTSYYALHIREAQNLTVENCTAKNFSYGFIYVPSAHNTNVVVKNTTIENVGLYGVAVTSGCAVDLTNVTIKNSLRGIYVADTAVKSSTITNCTFENVTYAIAVSGGGKTYNVNFVGVNDLGNGTIPTAANVKYTGVQVGTKIYGTLEDAWAAAQDGDTIKLLGNIAVSEGITNTKKVTLDLNGKTVIGTDNATGSFAIITNKGELTITGNGKITLTATNNRGWNAYSSVISNTVGGKLIVESGTIEHLGGTDMAYAIDNLTNGKGTYAEVVINGGTIKSTYRAIRMFLNGVEAENILTVNGGTIEGANKSIWVQDPSKNANTGKITVAAGATLNGDVYLYATADSAEWPVEVSIAANAVNNEVVTGNMPAGYYLEKVNGNYAVNKYVAQSVGKKYATLEDAIAAAKSGSLIKLLCDCEGNGLVIDKDITIEFNGFTYTLTGNAVGSANTTTNGIQILKGNTLELRNGTLKVADSAASKYAILIQNYGNLGLTAMTLDGTNLDYSAKVSYTLSTNSGKVTIKGIAPTTIKANDRNLDGDYAVDVYDYSSAGYALPTLVVNSGSEMAVEGKLNAAAYVKSGKVTYYATLEQAVKDTAAGKSITLLAPVVVNAGETLNLNKAVTISYTSNVAGEDMITVRGTLIVDGATLVYNNKDVTGSNVTVSTISAEPGSVVEIKSGSVKNDSANNGAKGIYAYAIDLLTNGNLGDVTVTISGGEVISTNYMAIRQFNNGTACKNTLTVTGGYIYGAKRAIQIHMDNNAAYLAISGGTVEAGKDGYALCLFPKNATNVAVTGGTFIGTIYSGTNGFIKGGIFGADLYAGYIADGYKFEGNKVVEDPTAGKVAMIGNKGYSTFAKAWAAAQNGDTITLVDNVIIDTETFTVADGKKITLDMNGYTITVTDNATANYELFYIYGEMVVTGKGTIELTSTNNREWNAMSAIFHNRGGVLTIENGTFKNLGGTDMAWVVDNSGNWYGDATTVINGGTLTSTYTAIRNRMEQNTHGASGKAILVINGGTIDGTTSAIWAQAASTSTVAPATGSITVNGGNVGLINTARSAGAVSMTTINGGTVAGFKGESGELTVNGGKITGTITILFADGATPKKTIVKDNVYYGAVAQSVGKYYATLEDAIAASKSGSLIKLLCDCEGNGLVIDKDITIEFNGYTYTFSGNAVGSANTTTNGIQILKGVTVELRNGTLKVADSAASKYAILIQNYGNLGLTAMTLDGTNLDYSAKVSYTLSTNSGKVTIKGTAPTTIKANDRNLDGDYAVDVYDYSSAGYALPTLVVNSGSKMVVEGKLNAAACVKSGKVTYYATLEQAEAANPSKKVTVLNESN